MKFVFLVQGEGRGHMIQALNLKESLENKGHVISKVLVGARSLELLPSFFTQKINCPIEIITSPKFISDKKDQGILLYKSAFLSCLETPAYIKSIIKIKKVIQEENPTAVISFYEPLAGLYFRFFKDRRPFFCIGHQYFMSHPIFNSYFKNFKEKMFFKVYNNFSSLPRAIKLCLSFSNEDDVIEKNLYVCPPLIKSQIKEMALEPKTEKADYFLVYILNRGYSKELVAWNKINYNFKLEAFRNSPEIIEERLNSSLVFYHLNNNLFNQKLKNCRAYISTSGFDSIAEAAYLGKKIMMLPIKNHFEQDYNAIDATRAKIAITNSKLDIAPLLEENNQAFSGGLTYRKWCDEYENKITDLIEKKCL